jgi:hypothetical protein
MDDPLRVRGRERRGDLLREVDGLHRRQRSAAGQELRERPPFDELHHDVLPVAVCAGVVDADDVRLVQAGRRLGLAPEPSHEAGVARELREQDLDRDRPAEDRVEASVDLGHPALADPSLDAVAVADHGIAHVGTVTSPASSGRSR